MDTGHTWNESERTIDPLTGRAVLRLTREGIINQGPTYHTNSAFAADGLACVLVSVRDGVTYVLKACVETGGLTVLWQSPGVGDRSYIHRGMEPDFPERNGLGISGNRLTIAPESRWAVFTCVRSIFAVHLDSLEVRTLLDDCGPEWIYGAPCVSPDEKWVTLCLSSAHPHYRLGKPVTTPYVEFRNHRLQILRMPLAGGPPETLFEHGPAQSAHCAYCPCDANLLYFDLDLPPKYWNGGDGKTPRIWLLDCAEGTARPLKDNYPGPFQVHQAWLWDGSAMAYHGPAQEGGAYIGLTAPDGRTIWEHTFPEAKQYGHLSPDPKRPALILDGDFAADRLQWIYYNRPKPQLRPICLHNTEWDNPGGQYSHPHPQASPTGRHILFTHSRAGRTDVSIVEIEDE